MARNYHVFDMIILGGGPAGQAALQEALKFTTNVALVSQTEEGVSQGIYAHRIFPFIGQMAVARRRLQEWNLADDEEMAQMLATLRAEQQKLHHEAEEALRPYAPYQVKGSGKFASPFSLRVDGRLLHFRSAIIATGTGGGDEALPFPEKTTSGYSLSVDAFYPWQCSLGVMMSALGVEVEIRYPRSCYGISRYHFSKWKALLPPSCRMVPDLPSEKALPLPLPSGMGLRAAGISKALWQEKRGNTFRLGDSQLFVAGEVTGAGKDALACAEEGRLAVREALGKWQPDDAVVPQQHFTLHGLPSLTVYGDALRAMDNEQVTQQVLQSPSFSGKEEDCRICLWQDKQSHAVLRAEITAYETAAAEGYVREWMRTASRPVLTPQEIAASPLLAALSTLR